MLLHRCHYFAASISLCQFLASGSTVIPADTLRTDKSLAPNSTQFRSLVSEGGFTANHAIDINKPNRIQKHIHNTFQLFKLERLTTHNV